MLYKGILRDMRGEVLKLVRGEVLKIFDVYLSAFEDKIYVFCGFL